VSSLIDPSGRHALPARLPWWPALVAAERAAVCPPWWSSGGGA